MKTAISVTAVLMLALSLGGQPNPVHADISVQLKGKRSAGSYTVHISNGKVHTLYQGAKKDDRVEAIYDSRGRAMTHLDHSRRQYFVLSEKEIDQIIKDMPPAENMAKMAIDSVSPKLPIPFLGIHVVPEDARRGVAKKVTKESDKAAPRYRQQLVKTGETRRYGGIPCTVYKAYVGSSRQSPKSELCIATRQAANISEADYKALMAMNCYHGKVSDLAQRGSGPLAFLVSDYVTKNVNGVVIYATSYTPATELSLVRVSRQPVPPAVFQIPSGYKKEKVF